MGIHALSSSIKSLPLLTCSMLWFIPKTKYYKNNVNSTEYNQLLSALAAVKERYILLKARELTQLSAKVAMFWQIFHLTPRPCSSTLQGSTQLIYHMQDVHKRKALSVWLPHALGFDRELSETPQKWLYPHMDMLRKSSVSLQWLMVHSSDRYLHTENEGAPCGPGKQYLCLGQLLKMHPQPTNSSCQKKGAQTWIHTRMCTHVHANTQLKGVRPWEKGMAGLHVTAEGPTLAAWPQPAEKHPTSGNFFTQSSVK